jgi:hypothetical protein
MGVRSRRHRAEISSFRVATTDLANLVRIPATAYGAGNDGERQMNNWDVPVNSLFNGGLVICQKLD